MSCVHCNICNIWFLDATFPSRWIGKDGPTPWPPQSPDIICLLTAKNICCVDRSLGFYCDTIHNGDESLKIKKKNPFLYFCLLIVFCAVTPCCLVSKSPTLKTEAQ